MKEFEYRGIFSSIKGKKEIKLKSSKSVPRRPKLGKARREGYPIIYKLKGTVKEYRKILSNPQSVCLINKRPQKYGILEKAYDMISKNAFYVFKKGDEKIYDFLHTHKVLFPNLDQNAIPNSKSIGKQFNTAGKKDLEKLRKALIQHLMDTPISSVFLIFSLSKLAEG